MSEFEQRVALFMRAIQCKKFDLQVKKLDKKQLFGLATVLADLSFNVSEHLLRFFLDLDSYFLYKPEIKKSDICHNAKSKLCIDCQEPECDLARGWKK